jgi:chaperonin GroEL
LANTSQYRARVAGPVETHEHLTMGINLIADLLAPTLGPIAGHIASQRDTRGPELLDDSATAVRRILDFGDPRIDIGAMLMRSLVWNTGERVGDGGATCAILARAVYINALRMIAGGINFRDLEQGILAGLEAVSAALTTGAMPVVSEDDLSEVAYTVVRDRALAGLLGEMSHLLGAEAKVNVQKYVAPYLEREYHAGANFGAEIASYLLYTDAARKQAVLTDCAVALVASNLAEAEDVIPLMETALAEGHTSLLILANGFKDAALHIIVTNQQAEKKKLSVLAAKIKPVGEERRYALDDMGLLTGATVLGQGFTPSPRKAVPEHLGKALRVEIDNGQFRLLPERQRLVDAQPEVELIRQRLAAMPQNDEDRPLLMGRLASLSGGMGTLKVGATGKLEREVRAVNAERALKVLSTAQLTGVVPGGGAAFLHARAALETIEFDGDARYGVKLIHDALDAPMRQILINAHVPAPGVIISQVQEAGPGNTYDVLTGKVGDAMQCGVLDVAGVLDMVLRTAVSTALMALSTDTIIYHKNPQQAMEP